MVAELEINEKLSRIIASVVQRSPDEVPMATKLSDLGWDSLSALEFMSACDSELGVSLNTIELADAKIVGDLYAIAISAVG